MVDTQIVETDDPRRMVADLVLPQLGRGGWAVAVAGLSTAGLANLTRLLTRLQDEDINTSRVFSMLARIPAGADIDHDRLVQTLRERSVYLGTAYADDSLQTALNRGDTLADQPVLANLIDTLLNRMYDLPVIAPAYHPDQPREPKPHLWPKFPRHGWFDRKRSA